MSYRIYGMYNCLNAITEREGEPQGVLIRAIEPLIGLDYIANMRYKKNFNELDKKQKLNLTSGPSKLCMALNIDKRLNNILLFEGDLFICDLDDELKSLFQIEEEKQEI